MGFLPNCLLGSLVLCSGPPAARRGPYSSRHLTDSGTFPMVYSLWFIAWRTRTGGSIPHKDLRGH